jgi:hypothetical protein
VAAAMARRRRLRACGDRVVLAVERSAHRRPTYRLGAGREFVVEALVLYMTRLATYCAGWFRILDGVLVELGDVSVCCEKSCSGRGTVAAMRIDVRSVLFLHVELGEPAHNCVSKRYVVVLAHLPLRERAPHGESNGFIPQRCEKA